MSYSPDLPAGWALFWGTAYLVGPFLVAWLFAIRTGMSGTERSAFVVVSVLLALGVWGVMALFSYAVALFGYAAGNGDPWHPLNDLTRVIWLENAAKLAGAIALFVVPWLLRRRWRAIWAAASTPPAVPREGTNE